MTSHIHLYTADKQPATSFVDRAGEIELHGGWKPDDQIYTDCCGKKRAAKYCFVMCFYDGTYIGCVDGRGCKNPQVIANKRRKEHMNRSRAQQKRREKERL